MKVVTFGELLIRLTSPNYSRLFQNNSFDTTFCGAEANVAVSLAIYGLDSAFITKLPEGDIGQAAINSLRQFGVNTSLISRGGKRIGLYYLERGASQRPSKVIYDREYSSIAMAHKDEFNWDEIFEHTDWFHFTGISPALSKNVADICLEACMKAKEKNITISCDLNFRKNLWLLENAGKIMSKFMPYVDVCIANEEDADKIFGIKAKNTDVSIGQLNYEGYKDVAKKLQEQFNFKYVATTLRSSISSNYNKWAAMLYSAEEEKFYFSKEYNINIVDRVGGGDSFGAGLIYGFTQNMPLQECLEFAVAASCLKHSIEGDFNRVSVEEVKRLMHGNESGRIER